MASLVIGLLSVVFGIGCIASGCWELAHHDGCVKKAAIVDAWKAMDWQIYGFEQSGIAMTDKKGRDKFYAVEDIDAAIARMNQAMR